MNPRDLVQAAMDGNDLAARQWVKDAKRARVDLASLPRPSDLQGDALCVAAGLVEMFAARAGRQAPDWTRRVGAAAQPVYLCSSSLSARRVCAARSPEALRWRNVFAFGDYLNVL